MRGKTLLAKSVFPTSFLKFTVFLRMITENNGGTRKSRRLSIENITMAIYELAGAGVLLRTALYFSVLLRKKQAGKHFIRKRSKTYLLFLICRCILLQKKDME